MVTAITRGLAATMWFPSGTSLATTTTMTVAATMTTGATVAATTRIGATVAATTRIGATVVYPSATTTGTVTQPGMVGLSATPSKRTSQVIELLLLFLRLAHRRAPSAG